MDGAHVLVPYDVCFRDRTALGIFIFLAISRFILYFFCLLGNSLFRRNSVVRVCSFLVIRFFNRFSYIRYGTVITFAFFLLFVSLMPFRFTGNGCYLFRWFLYFHLLLRYIVVFNSFVSVPFLLRGKQVFDFGILQMSFTSVITILFLLFSNSIKVLSNSRILAFS